MKQLFNLKSIIRLSLLALCLFSVRVGNMWGETRTFDGNTKFYVMNYKPSGLGGSTLWAISDECKFYFDLVDGSAGHHWYEAELVAGSAAYSEGAIYAITPAAGTYSYFIMTRGKGKSFDDATNQTGNIGFHSDASYNLVNGGYDKDGTGTTWGKVSPKPVTSDGTGILYFNGKPSSASWWSDYGADRQSAFFYNNSSGVFTSTSISVTGDYYKVIVPSGTWTGVILTRHNEGTSTPSWENKCNQTQDIPLVEGKNYLSDFGEAPGTYIWDNYIPSGTTLLNGSMNDWSLISAKPIEDGALELELPAHKTYSFKIVEGGAGGSGDWYGLYAGNCIISTMSLWGCTKDQNTCKNIIFNTASEGTYTFAYNASHQLSVTYPDTKHPNLDYIYMIRYDWSDPRLTIPNATASGIGGTDDNGQQLKLTGTSTINDTTEWNIDGYKYFYAAVGEYPTIRFHQINNEGGNNSGNTTPVLGQRLYWNGSAWTWGTIQVYIELENNGADIKKGTLGWDVAFNDSALSTAINTPQKSHYDFGGYYTGDGGTGKQIINAEGEWQTDETDYFRGEGAWIHAGDTTKLYAKWTKHPYAIDLAVTPNHVEASDPATGGTIQIGGEDKISMNAYQDSASVDIYAVPAAGYKFKEWRFSQTESIFDVYVDDNETYSSISNPIKIRAGHTGTLTAVFEPRYELAGSTLADSEVKGGMPGWSYDGTGVFTVNSTSPVNLTCTCSLSADTWYKFQIHDRIDGNFGDGTDGKYELIKGNRAHCSNATMDMKFHTTGEGKYIFEIDEIDGSNRPYVKLYWPWQVQYGWKYKDEDGSLSEGGGGTVSVTATEDGEDRSVSIGGYIMHGGHISFTATPYDDYNFAGWWTSDSYAGNPQWDSGSPTVDWDVDKEDAKAYAKFTEKTNTLSSGTTWNTGTWSAGHQPTADEVAIIQSPVEVDITTAKAKKVLIMQNSPNTGQLEIPAGKELVVRTTIRKTTDGSTYGATGENDIIIGSTLANGNGALVMGAHDGTNKATVYFATKAKTVEQDGKKHNVNQFIGTPFNDENDILYDYYGTKIYEFKAAHDGDKGTYNEWQRVASTGQQMLGFKGYNILTNQTESPVLEMTGTLSRTNTTETIDGYYNGSSNTENMFANSWVAPIYIPNFKDTCFVNIEKTIYIFNAGTPKDQEGHAMGDGTAETEAAGQYSVLPANSSVYTGLKVIPSMQAFSVFAKGENPKLKFDYNELVNNPSNGTAGIVPNRAPQRTNDEDAPNVLRLAATGESGYAAKIVLLERTDFTEGYDDGWDGRFLAGDDAAPQLYAVTSDGNMAINCSPEVEGTVLGFKAGEADEVFTFSFDYDGEALYLYDTQTQTYTRVLTGNTYTFTTNDLAAHNRFILTYNAPQMPTVITNTLSDTKAVKFIENDHLYIFQNGRLYDAAGRIVK